MVISITRNPNLKPGKKIVFSNFDFIIFVILMNVRFSIECNNFTRSQVSLNAKANLRKVIM